MSNYLAIATVTAALGRMVHAAAESSGVGSVSLDFGKPTAVGEGSTARKVHIYLYQIIPNAALGNNDLPTRDPEGRLVNRPVAALNLRYLIAFYGNQQTLEPDRMLGAVVRNLHARPLLSRKSIQDAITDHSELASSDLADSIEQVRLTPAAISLDELSKLWSVFFQTPHALSVIYNADVVLIEAVESGPSALPVLKRGKEDRGVESKPDILSSFPELSSIHIGNQGDMGIEPLPPSFPAAQLGSYLILSGKNLAGDIIEVQFSHARYSEPNHPQRLESRTIAVPLEDRSSTKIRIKIPDEIEEQSKWRVGLYTVSVIVSAAGKKHYTNKLPLLLAPKIRIGPPNSLTPDMDGFVVLSITASPVIMETQMAALLFADQVIEADEIEGDKLRFAFAVTKPAAGIVVRLRVDGVDSIPFERVGTPPRFQFAENQKVTINERD